MFLGTGYFSAFPAFTFARTTGMRWTTVNSDRRLTENHVATANTIEAMTIWYRLFSITKKKLHTADTDGVRQLSCVLPGKLQGHQIVDRVVAAEPFRSEPSARIASAAC